MEEGLASSFLLQGRLERPWKGRKPLCSSLPSPALEKKGASREGRESFQEKGEGRQPGKKKLFVLS